MRARCTCARLSRRWPLILVGNNRHYVPRHTRDNGFSQPSPPHPSFPSPFRLVRTSYNRCSYVPLTRRATITLMHCPVFRRLTTPAPHRRFALSQIELNRITGSRTLKSLSRELHCRSYPMIHRLALSRIKHHLSSTLLALSAPAFRR